MKGIILAGGLGTRLYPITNLISKHLLPVFGKPMIYYPLSTLLLSNIREIAIVSTPHDIPFYKKLLGDGSKWGVNFTYIIQEQPKGIADVFRISSNFIGKGKVMLILGDNIFHGNMKMHEIKEKFDEGCLIFGYSVSNPSSYGVVEIDSNGKIVDLVEKPSNPKSNLAIPGLYLYDNDVLDIANSVIPSDRGELEITDVNRNYLERDKLSVQILGRGISWMDAGTVDGLHKISSLIKSVETNQKYKIGCPEEIALRMNFIDVNMFKEVVSKIPKSPYRDYLEEIYRESKSFTEEGIEKLKNIQP